MHLLFTNMAAIVQALGLHDSPMPPTKTPAGLGRAHRAQVAAARVQPGFLKANKSRQVKRAEWRAFCKKTGIDYHAVRRAFALSKETLA